MPLTKAEEQELITLETKEKGVSIPSALSPEEEQELQSLENKVYAPQPVGIKPSGESMTWGQVGKEAISNIPESAGQYLSNIYQVIRHPIDTSETLGQLAVGLVEKLIPGEQKDEKTIDDFGNFLRERYGSIDNIKQTIANDPVGFVSDLSTVVMGAGAAVSKTGQVAKLGGVTQAGKTIGKVGAAIEPLSIAKAIPVGIAKKTPQSVIDKLYASSVKMSTVLPAAERAKRITTGLDEAILPTEKGLHKLWGRINDTNKAISDNIVDAARKGEKINADMVVGKLDDLRSFYKNTLNPAPFLDEIDDIEKTFRDAHGSKIPIDKAQKIKQNTYVLLKKHYGELKNLNIEAQKTLARGIKEEIAKLHPEINTLNKTDSALMSLEESIERATARIRNRDLIGLGVKTGTGVGGAVDVVTGMKGPGLLTGLTTSILDTPVVKAMLSIVLHKAKNRAFTNKYAVPRNVLYQTGRTSELEE